MKNLSSMLRQFQDMQESMESARKAMAAIEVEGTSGGGMVTVRLNGQSEMLSLDIDPSIVDPGEVDVLEDLVRAAHADARAKVEQELASRIGSLLPPGLSPFGN